MDIRFSVIIPLYNKEKLIQRTLDSVLSQTYVSFEVVVVNDGSTDSSQTIVESNHDSRIRLYNKSNGGVSSARNYGIEKAQNSWIVPLDADDIMLPHALQTLAFMIEKYPQERYFSGRTKWGDHCKGAYEFSKVKKTKYPHLMIWLRKIDPAPRNIVFHKSLVQKCGGYDDRMSYYEDWEFSIRLAFCGSIVYTDTYLAEYTQDGQGLSASIPQIKKTLAFYIPELLNRYPGSFWYKALLFENLELMNQTCEYSRSKPLFASIFSILHSIRQRLLNHHLI